MKEESNPVAAGHLVRQLLEKSKSGKLKWEPTANRSAFVASVGGETLFRIKQVDVDDIDEFGQPTSYQVPALQMLDEKGQVLWDVGERDVASGDLSDLYNQARRIGNRIDERVAGALDALEKL